MASDDLPVLIVGDVHGDIERLFAALKPYPATEWRTIFLGDLVDYGMFGVGVLRYARDRPNTEVLLGNHEVAMLWALRDPGRIGFWISIGGQRHDLDELRKDRQRARPHCCGQSAHPPAPGRRWRRNAVARAQQRQHLRNAARAPGPLARADRQRSSRLRPQAAPRRATRRVSRREGDQLRRRPVEVAPATPGRRAGDRERRTAGLSDRRPAVLARPVTRRARLGLVVEEHKVPLSHPAAVIAGRKAEDLGAAHAFVPQA
ncbi:MAG: hypothetical protein E6J06_10825 [Chloroflexi bacterium]|nr:MAG: hypothetical protein E6J06_10825 [Chloroflexota bacterium]